MDDDEELQSSGRPSFADYWVESPVEAPEEVAEELVTLDSEQVVPQASVIGSSPYEEGEDYLKGDYLDAIGLPKPAPKPILVEACLARFLLSLSITTARNLLEMNFRTLPELLACDLGKLERPSGPLTLGQLQELRSAVGARPA